MFLRLLIAGRPECGQNFVTKRYVDAERHRSLRFRPTSLGDLIASFDGVHSIQATYSGRLSR